jgi:hypothetical protein
MLLEAFKRWGLMGGLKVIEDTPLKGIVRPQLFPLLSLSLPCHDELPSP